MARDLIPICLLLHMEASRNFETFIAGKKCKRQVKIYSYKYTLDPKRPFGGPSGVWTIWGLSKLFGSPFHPFETLLDYLGTLLDHVRTLLKRYMSSALDGYPRKTRSPGSAYNAMHTYCIDTRGNTYIIS